MEKSSEKEYLCSKLLRENVRDLLLLHLWELHEKNSCDVQNFTLLGVLGQPNSQVVIMQAGDKTIRSVFQTALPQSAKVIIYDLGDAVVMLSEQQAEEILKIYCDERGITL